MAGHFTPGDQFQFTCSTLTDPARGRTDGLLERCRARFAGAHRPARPSARRNVNEL